MQWSSFRVRFKSISFGSLPVSDLKDAWTEKGVTEGVTANPDGNTCELPTNIFVDPGDLRKRPLGQRIDYLLYR